MKFLTTIIGFLFFISFNLVASATALDDYSRYLIRDNVDAVKELIDEGLNPNSTLPNGNTLLNAAILENAFKSARFLINHKKINLDLRNKSDETPLMIASLRGNLDLVKTLVFRGADVNKTGWAPLHYAASGGHIPVMKFLLDKNAYIDATSPSGNTPLMMATLYGSDESVSFLLAQGADPTILNGAKRSAIDLAKATERVTLVELIEKNIQKWLVQSAKEQALAQRSDMELQKQLREERLRLKKIEDEKQSVLVQEQQQALKLKEEFIFLESLGLPPMDLATREGLDAYKYYRPERSNAEILVQAYNSNKVESTNLPEITLPPYSDLSTIPQLIKLERKVISVAYPNGETDSNFKVATIELQNLDDEPAEKAEPIKENLEDADYEIVIDPITYRLKKIPSKLKK